MNATHSKPAGAARIALAASMAAALAVGCQRDDASVAADAAALDATVSAPDVQGPHIVVDEPLHEFGEVKMGTKVQHVFKIRNGGTEPLLIRRVRGT